MKKICDKCGGSGTLPQDPDFKFYQNTDPETITVRVKKLDAEYQVADCGDLGYKAASNIYFNKDACEVIPKTPPVITVRITGCSEQNWDWYKDNIGECFEAIKSYYSDGSIFYAPLVSDGEKVIHVDHCEPIPPLLPGYRLRRKWGKDEEMTEYGDKRWDGEFWVMSPRDGFTQGTYIYITPIKPATPDQSADCLPVCPMCGDKMVLVRPVPKSVLSRYRTYHQVITEWGVWE